VPGDLFELPEDNATMPCDALLISGSVIVNESVLTGESTPIIKSHIPNSTEKFNKKKHSKYIIYSGTKIIQTRNIRGNKVMGLVISTGFNTEKGSLVRSILFPKGENFKFKVESIKYIIFMGILSNIGFLITLATDFLLNIPLPSDRP
jgi:cation-transporting ATPase 13A3/4/5